MDSVIKILGNKINCFASYKALYDRILVDKRSSKLHGYITVNNVHTLMEGYWSAEYQEIINNGYLAIPDGKPLEIIGRIKGNNEISRLFGPSVMENFINWGRSDRLTHFFFGSSEENLNKLRAVIESKYPGTEIVGMIAPPYKPIELWDNEQFIDEINNAKPDFIWIGLGAPKQERWMFANYKKIDKGILFGIGAGFDYLAGNTKHAPQWMKNASLEWLYRLVQEPKRLWKRYFKTIPPFIFYASFELIGIKFKKDN